MIVSLSHTTVLATIFYFALNSRELSCPREIHRFTPSVGVNVVLENEIIELMENGVCYLMESICKSSLTGYFKYNFIYILARRAFVRSVNRFYALSDRR